jgi:c-di-GMP-binding flagellar brake protein YcgR
VKSQDALSKRGLKPEYLCVTQDISAGGLLFPAPEPLALGAIIELKVELPNGESPIECLARVVRCQETEHKPYHNVAVCFLDITGADRGKLNKYVEEESRA